MQIVGNEAFFTKEEEDRIDRLLAEVDEEQKRNGNKLYSHDEVWGQLLGEKYYKDYLQGTRLSEIIFQNSNT